MEFTKEQFKDVSIAALIAPLPIVGIIYAIGYLVIITYYRYLGIHTIDLLKSSCFESGFSYVLCLFIITSFVLLPFVVFKLITNKEERPTYVSPYVSYIGLALSVVSAYLIIYAICHITLFLRPGEWPDIEYYFNSLLFYGVSGIFILLVVNKNTNGMVRNLKLNIKIITLINDIIRLTLFCLVSYYFYMLFFVKLQSSLTMFTDKVNSYFILYTIILIVLIFRFVKNLQKKDSTSRLIIVSVISIVVLFLNIKSFTFGPFVYIPTNNGGSYHYSTVKIALSDKSNIEGINKLYQVSDGSSVLPDSLLFLVETNKYIYFAPYEKIMTPRELFVYLLNDKVFSIDRNIVQFIKYERLNFGKMEKQKKL